MNPAVAVPQAWGEILPDAPPDLPWDVAGGDSLATLHLVFRLEQLLGRTLSLDVVQPDMTQAALIAALGVEATLGQQAGVSVFLLPGLYGDEPGLAAFRRGLAGRVAFDLIDLPGIGTPAAVLANVRATGALAAREIARRQPDGPLILGGYSFGGGVALEAAVHLTKAGREVALVVVIDTAFGDAVLGPGTRALQAIWWRGPLAYTKNWFVTYDLLRAFALAMADWVDGERGARLRNLIMRRLRTWARMAWVPSPIACPMLIIVSDEFWAVNAATWARFFPEANICRIAATHHGLIRGVGLPSLIAAFAAAVELQGCRL